MPERTREPVTLPLVYSTVVHALRGSSLNSVGFGLGFSVQIDPAAYRVLSSPDEFAWGGAASTAFWCDPHEDIAVVFLTQLLPSSTHPIRTQLKQLVYQALVD